MKRKTRLLRQEEGAALLARLIDLGHQPELTSNIPHFLLELATQLYQSLLIIISIATRTESICLTLHAPIWQADLCARRNIVSLSPKLGHELKLTTAPGHVFGKPTKKEACYDNLHISRNAWDTNLVKVRINRSEGTHVADTRSRLTLNILRSIGKAVEVAHLLLYLSTRRVDCLNGFPFSEDTLPRCWIRIGVFAEGCRSKHDANSHPGILSTTVLLLLDPMMARYLYGRYHRVSHYNPAPKIQQTLRRSASLRGIRGMRRGSHTGKLANAPAGKLDRSSSTPRPKTFLPPPPAITQ